MMYSKILVKSSAIHLWKRLLYGLLAIAGLVFFILLMAPIWLDPLSRQWYCRDYDPQKYTADELQRNPLQQPSVFTYIPKYIMADEMQHDFVIVINVVELWESSNRNGNNVLQRSTCVTINDVPVNYRVYTFGPSIGMYNDEGELIDWIGGYGIMIIPPLLEPGLHTASIRIQSVMGTRYTYQWSFRITD